MPDIDPPRCSLCGAELVRTSEWWWVCGKGHGPLIAADKFNRARASQEEREFLRKVDKALKETSKP